VSALPQSVSLATRVAIAAKAVGKVQDARAMRLDAQFWFEFNRPSEKPRALSRPMSGRAGAV
jgi:hypothetical protein